MKKLFVLLLALTCVGVAFAQDAAPAMTFGMYGDVETTLITDKSVTGYYVYTETYFNYKQADMYFSATTTQEYTTAGQKLDMFAAFRDYRFSYTLMKDLDLKVMAGNLRGDGGARLTSYVDGNGFSTRVANASMNGFGIFAAPIPGLAVAAIIPTLGGKVDVDYAKVNLSVSYTLTDLAKIVAGYRMENKELWASVGVLAIKDVTARLGFKMVDTTALAGGANTPYVYISGGTKMGDLDVGLDADIVLASTLGYGAKLYGQYTMGTMDVGAEVSFDNGKDAWYKFDGLNINPYAQFNFSKGDIVVGLIFDTKTSTWSIPIDFEVSF